MTVFVTGGTGFLGRHLVSRLIREGDQVRCLVRKGADLATLISMLPSERLNQLEFVEGNLGNASTYADAMHGCTVLFHLAAEMRGATAILFLANVVGTRALMAAAIKAKIDRFVLTSSLAVYDAGRIQPGQTLDENCPIDPNPQLRDPYTYSKIAQEEVCWDAFRKDAIPLTVVRPGVIFGPGRDCLSGRVGLRLGRWFLCMGGGQKLPYTHVENCALAIRLAGLSPTMVGRAVNIIDDDLMTAKELLRQYRRSVGGVRSLRIPSRLIPALSWMCEWYHQKSRGQLPAILTRYKSRAMWTAVEYSNQRAKSLLGWSPKQPFEDGIRETLNSLTRK